MAWDGVMGEQLPDNVCFNTMLLRKDYIENRLERVSRNIAYIQELLKREEADDKGELLQNLTRLQTEYSSLLDSAMKIEKKSLPGQKLRKRSRKTKENKQGEQWSLF